MLRLLLSLLVVLFAGRPMQAQDDIVLYSLSYSPDGDYVAGVGNRVVVWDGETAQIVANIGLYLGSSDSLLLDAVWSPDGDRLAVAGTDRKIRVLDFSDNAQPLGAQLAEFELMTFLGVRSIGWSPDGGLIAIGGDETSPKMEFWDASTYEFIRATPYSVFAYRMAWHPDPQRNLLAVTDGYFDGAQLVNTSENAPRSDTILCGDCAPDAIALPLAWNSDGSLIAIGHTNGQIFVVHAESDTVLTSMQAGPGVYRIAWTNDDQYVLSLSRAGLQVWDSTTGSLLNEPAKIEAGVFALNPVNNQIFVFYNGADVGEIVELSTLIESTPSPPLTLTPTPQK
jgi:WD40 repeat protein